MELERTRGVFGGNLIGAWRGVNQGNKRGLRFCYRQSGLISSTIILSAFDMRSLERLKSGTLLASRIFANPTVMSSSGCLIPRLFFKVCSAFLNCSLLIVIFVASFIWDRSATPITKTFYEIVAGIRICIIYGCHYKPAVPIGKYNRPTTTNASILQC